MQQCVFAVVTAALALATSGSALKCYQCLINPKPGEYYNTTKQLCVHFDHSDRFIVDCPYSTMCMKQDFHLDIQNGVRINGVLRNCAPQTFKYQDYKNGQWSPKMEVMEPYKEGCVAVDDKGERTPTTTNCYCRSDLCNTSNTNHEGYTDIMGVIVVFNLMKYINSLR